MTKRTDSDVIVGAIARYRAGEPVPRLVEELGVSKSVLYAAIARAPVAKKSARAKTPAASRAPAPSACSSDADLIDRGIERLLARLDDPQHGHGVAATAKALGDLVRRRREMRPPENSADDEEQRWRVAADAVLTKIEAGVKAAETARAANGATPCPHCGGARGAEVAAL